MVRTSAYHRYLENEVLTAEPLQLVVLLYQGALDSISGARFNRVERYRMVGKAIAIVDELNRTLDQKRGGDLAHQLSRLYQYILGRLTEAQLKQSDESLVEPEQLLTTLLEAWRQCETPSAAFAGTGAGPYGQLVESDAAAVDYAW